MHSTTSKGASKKRILFDIFGLGMKMGNVKSENDGGKRSVTLIIKKCFDWKKKSELCDYKGT